MNFALIMFLLLVGTGAVWLLDHLLLKRRRPSDEAEPWWVEYPKSFFPVILVVGTVAALLLTRYQTLAPCTGFHMAFNLIQLAALLWSGT